MSPRIKNLDAISETESSYQQADPKNFTRCSTNI